MVKTAARVLCFLALAGLLLYPALADPHALSQHYDWRYFDTTCEIARRAVVWFHEPPLWNPYSCGGEVDLANPQSMAAAPTFLLVLLLGTALGTKLALWAYGFFALDGTHRLARALGASPEAALLAALCFGLCGYLAMHLSSGHSNFAGVALYPYLLLCFVRSLRGELRFVVPLALCAAWIAALGGTFTPPMAAELLFAWAVAEAAARRSARPFLILAAALLMALCFSAARALPSLQFLIDHPRPPFRRTPDVSAPWQVLGDLVIPRLFGPVAGRRYYSHEYTAKLPYALLPLCALGLAQALRARAYRLPVLALLALLLSMGNFSPLAPWSLLQKLPVLRDLRVPSRHIVLLCLPLSLLAATGWDALRPRLPRPRLLCAALALLAAGDGVYYASLLWREGRFNVHLPIPEAPIPFYHEQGHWRVMRELVFAGHGVLGCDEEAPLQRAEALDAGPGPQARMLDPEAGAARELRASHNQREVEVTIRPGYTGAVLLLNSNWNEHWTAAPGRVTKIAGRLAVDLSGVPTGTPQRVVLRYAPRTFTYGAWLSALSLPLALGWFLRRRRQDVAYTP